jgi:hypothetical protein
MAASNKCLQRSNKSRRGARRLTGDRQRGAFPLALRREVELELKICALLRQCAPNL